MKQVGHVSMFSDLNPNNSPSNRVLFFTENTHSMATLSAQCLKPNSPNPQLTHHPDSINEVSYLVSGLTHSRPICPSLALKANHSIPHFNF